MRFQFFYTLIFFSLCFGGAASAEGMKYTTLSQEKEPLKTQNLEIKSLNYKQKEKESLKRETETKQEKETMDAVWERYKALATGKKDDNSPKLAEPAKPKKISVEKQKIPYAAASSDQKKQGGFNILDRYEEVKSRRSQMKMITIKPGKDATSDK